MEVINAINSLKLDRLDADFVKNVWDEEFEIDAVLPDEYMELVESWDITIFNEIITAVDKWQMDDSTPNVEEKTWKELSELNLDHKALLTILWYFIVNGQESKTGIDAKYGSLRAATLYLKLLAVSGSRVYHAFHPSLCLKTISVLKHGIIISAKHKKNHKKQSGGGKLNTAFGNDFNDIGSNLHGKEMVCFINELVITVETLKSFVIKFSLQSNEDLLEEVIERLAEITRIEVNTSNFMTYRSSNKSQADVALSTLSYTAYETLKSLCTSDHGEVEETLILIMKHLLPGVLLTDNELSFREQCIVREHTVHFVKYLLTLLGEVTFRGITLLIHNIFTKIGDRAETRQKGKESIVDIMLVLPNKQYKNLVKWLFDCCHCDRASFRLLALEIIAQLLHDHKEPVRESIHENNENAENMSTEFDVDINNVNENYTEDTEMEDDSSANPPSTVKDILLHKYMLAVIFARFRDSSSSVRTKALGLLVQCMKSDNMVVRSLMNEIFVLNQQIESSERGFLNYKQLQAALKNKSNVDPLPSAGMILSELKNLTSDNKVYVRKAALQTLENIMTVNRSWLTGNILKIMGLCCRDPAVSIRKEMVQILSDLLLRYPDDQELIKVWAKSVVPLVFDQEGKLQECVLKVISLNALTGLRD
ncbi:hypothetical protein L9F63_017490, partial [Diploptera punctata]